MFLPSERAKNYSRMERKNFDGWMDGEKFRSDTPKEILNFIIQREKSKGYFWCPTHGKWEYAPQERICFPDFVPPDYKPEGGNQDGQSPERDGEEPYRTGEGNTEGEGEAEGNGQKEGEPLTGEEAQKALEQLMKEINEQQGQEEKEKESPYTTNPVKGDEIEWNELGEDKYGKSWDNKIVDIFPKTEEGKQTVIVYHKNERHEADKSPIKGGFTMHSDGNLKMYTLEGYKDIGKIKKQPKPSEQQESENESGEGMPEQQQQSKEDEKQSPPKKWLKFILNRCPDCKIETLQKLSMNPPKPIDPWDRIDYTEKTCGCKVLSALFGEEKQLDEFQRLKRHLIFNLGTGEKYKKY